MWFRTWTKHTISVSTPPIDKNITSFIGRKLILTQWLQGINKLCKNRSLHLALAGFDFNIPFQKYQIFHAIILRIVNALLLWIPFINSYQHKKNLDTWKSNKDISKVQKIYRKRQRKREPNLNLRSTFFTTAPLQVLPTVDSADSCRNTLQKRKRKIWKFSLSWF